MTLTGWIRLVLVAAAQVNLSGSGCALCVAFCITSWKASADNVLDKVETERGMADMERHSELCLPCAHSGGALAQVVYQL